MLFVCLCLCVGVIDGMVRMWVACERYNIRMLFLGVYGVDFLINRQRPRSTLSSSSAGSDVYKWQAYTLLLPGLCMAYAWLMHGSCMAYAWLMHGLCMAYAWSMLGLFMAYAWLMRGLCKAYTWLMHGFFMAFPWLMHGLC